MANKKMGFKRKRIAVKGGSGNKKIGVKGRRKIMGIKKRN